MSDFINTRNLPSKGKPGDVYRDAASTRLYIALGDGSLCDLNDLLSEARPAVRLVGPPGERGPVGAQGDFLDSAHLSERIASLERLYADLMARVERGDEAIVGPKGDSIKGDKGDPGDILYVDDAEVRAAAYELHQKTVKLRAVLWNKIIRDTPNPHVRKHMQRCMDEAYHEAGL